MIRHTLKLTTPSEREIVMTREFDAPRHLVFAAWTKPELLRRWHGVFGGWSMEVCEFEAWAGGSYQFVWQGSAGQRMRMSGVVREIVAPERIVATERFNDNTEEILSTLALVEHGGKTSLTNTVLCPTQEIRDAILRTPMEKGVGAGYDALDGVLLSLLSQ
jgi:uncharacterized protein YndB with AHSA1/START domain